jgi:cytochrome bd-type quinol oxidase subunit 2
MAVFWSSASSGRERLASLFRVFVGLLGLITLGVQFAIGQQQGTFNAVNFFSYFTILSNVFAGIVFLLTGLTGGRTRTEDSLRGAATLYLAVTFIVYALLLAAFPLGIVRPWINTVLHRLMPVAALVDWLFTPPKHRPAPKQILVWLIGPALFLIYSLIRGANVNWYPYPFLDPRKVGGYGTVAIYSVAITLLFVLLAFGLSFLPNQLRASTEL